MHTHKFKKIQKCVQIMYKRNTHHTNNILYYYIAIAELHFNTVHGLNPCLGSNIEHRSDKTN